MQADWRIPDSFPLFMVSSDGRVKIADTGEYAKIRDNGNGYKQVQIMRNAKRYTKYVHRLVAECFIENPDCLPEVNHKDGDKSNNTASNLEWCSRSQNLLHAYKYGLKPNTTPKQQEAARRNAALSSVAMRDGWKRWAKTEMARECWKRNLSKADMWGKRRKPCLTSNDA